MDNQTEQLADGVWRIELAPYVNVFLLANDGRGDGEGLTLVDSGIQRLAPRIVKSIRNLSLDPRAVQDVLLSHWHPDHAGSARRLRESSAQPAVWVGEEDLGVVTGRQSPAEQAAGPADVTRLGRLWCRVNRAGPPVPDARALRDRDHRDVAGGLDVIATPGHTPGHCAFHLPAAGVMLAGDAIFNVFFASRGPLFAANALSRQAASLRRLAECDFRLLAPVHGPPLEGPAAHATLDRLARKAARD